MHKKILIIAYQFPPMGGVGTRRWTKFSKYLARRGHEVYVLTSHYPYEDKGSWQYDVDASVQVRRFRSRYPAWLLQEAQNPYVKQLKRYVKFFLKKTLFYIDIAQHDAKAILGSAKEIIAEQTITNVIATGHPVSVNYIVTYLKIDHPQLNLIQDFRDNWNDLKAYHYPHGLQFFFQKRRSVMQEFLSVFYADTVVNVSEDLTKMLRKKHAALPDKFVTIHNGYDTDDFKEKVRDAIDNTQFNMIYTGSLYNERIGAIYLLLDAVLELNDPYINKHFTLVLYTNYGADRFDKKYRKFLGNLLVVHDFIPPQEVMSVLASYRYCLSVNSKFAAYAYGTKVFDYMALNKKIVHISNGGALFDTLHSKGQFVSNYDLEEMKQLLREIKSDFQQKKEVPSPYADFSIEQLTTTVERYLV